MDGAIFLQQVVNGMSLGGMYALIAIGYAMVYGVLRLINFAHADVMMVGAFSTLFLFSSVGLPFGVAVFLTLGLCGLFGMLIDRVAYRPLRQASKISMLITAIGVSFFLENLFNVLFGGSSRFFSAPDFFNQTRAFGSVIITNVAWIVPLITVLLLLAILWLLYRTRYGMAIRAVAFDVNTVRLMGIDANRIISLVFALGSSLRGPRRRVLLHQLPHYRSPDGRAYRPEGLRRRRAGRDRQRHRRGAGRLYPPVLPKWSPWRSSPNWAAIKTLSPSCS